MGPIHIKTTILNNPTRLIKLIQRHFLNNMELGKIQKEDLNTSVQSFYLFFIFVIFLFIPLQIFGSTECLNFIFYFEICTVR